MLHRKLLFLSDMRLLHNDIRLALQRPCANFHPPRDVGQEVNIRKLPHPLRLFECVLNRIQKGRVASVCRSCSTACSAAHNSQVEPRLEGLNLPGSQNDYATKLAQPAWLPQNFWIWVQTPPSAIPVRPYLQKAGEVLPLCPTRLGDKKKVSVRAHTLNGTKLAACTASCTWRQAPPQASSPTLGPTRARLLPL